MGLEIQPTAFVPGMIIPCQGLPQLMYTLTACKPKRQSLLTNGDYGKALKRLHPQQYGTELPCRWILTWLKRIPASLICLLDDISLHSEVRGLRIAILRECGAH